MTKEHLTSEINTDNFRITTRQNRIKRNQVTALHLMIGFLLFMMGLVTWSVPLTMKTARFAFLDVVGILYSVFGFCLVVVSVFFNKRVIQKSRWNQLLRVIEILVLLSILIYTVIQKWYLPVAYSSAALLVIVFAFWWERNAGQESIIQINKGGIAIPKFLGKTFLKWQQVSHIVLRHSVLTIDCLDNRLYQLSITKVEPEATSMEKFESFCSEMIQAHEHLREEEW